MNERWLSVSEIADHLGVSKDTIYRLLDNRKIPAHRIGKFWKFKEKEVDDWVMAGKAANKNFSSNKGKQRKK